MMFDCSVEAAKKQGNIQCVIFVKDNYYLSDRKVETIWIEKGKDLEQILNSYRQHPAMEIVKVVKIDTEDNIEEQKSQKDRIVDRINYCIEIAMKTGKEDSQEVVEDTANWLVQLSKEEEKSY